MPQVPKVPNGDWDIKSLESYVRTGMDEIQKAGRFTAVQTYRIGRALFFARRKMYETGGWNKWLGSVGIPLSNAREAILLYEAVKKESDLSELTATEAKIKYGVYSDFTKEKSPSGKGIGGGGRGLGGGGLGGGGSFREDAEEEAPPQDPEQMIDLLFRRCKAAADLPPQIPWTPEMLYLPEVDGALEFCQTISKYILKKRSKIKRPKRKVDTSYLDELDAA